jgi:carbonic anhydrase
METFTTEIMGDLLSSSLKTSSVGASGWHDSNAGDGTTDGKYINWLTITDQEKSVLEDVQRIRNNSMVPSEIPIYGYIYDCKTGSLNEVLAATEAGKVG